MTGVLVYGALLLTSCSYALLRGGAPERVGAAILLTGSIITPIVTPPGSTFHFVEVRLLLVDLADQAALLMLALRANRFWTIAAASIHWLSIAANLAKGTVHAITPAVYGRTEQISFYLILVLLAVGTWRHRQRLRRYGSDRSWSISSCR